MRSLTLSEIKTHVRVDYIDQPLNQGIDGKFKNPQTGEYIIVETKFGQSGLSTLADGTKQMERDWIDARLIQEVEEEVAEDILTNGYTSVLSKVSQNGDVQYFLLDVDANIIGSWSPHN